VIESLVRKDQRIQLYSQLEAAHDLTMSRIVLGDLVRDFPQDPGVLKLVKTELADEQSETDQNVQENQSMQARQAELESQLRRLGRQFSTLGTSQTDFQTLMGSFTQLAQQRWTEEDKSQAIQESALGKLDGQFSTLDKRQTDFQTQMNSFTQLAQKRWMEEDKSRAVQESTLGKLGGQFSTLDAQQADFQTRMSSFAQLAQQRWTEEDKSRAYQAVQKQTRESEDFLYRIFREKPAEQPEDPERVKQRLEDLGAEVQGQAWAKAKAESREVLRSDPSNAQAAAYWLFALVNEAPEVADPNHEYIPLVETLLRLIPGDFFCLFSSAVFYENEGALILASDRYQRALEANPRFFPAKRNLVSVFERLGDEKKAHQIAFDLWNGGSKSDETALLAWGTLSGDSLAVQAQFLEDWKKSLPASALCDRYEGDMKYQAKAYSAAAALFQSSLAKGHTRIAQQKLADSLFAANRFPEAALAYRQVLRESNPQQRSEQAAYIQNAEQLLSSDFQSKQWNDTISDGLDLLQQFPETTAAMSYVGRAYLASGDLTNARKILEAGAAKPDGLPLLGDLFQVYWSLKQFHKILDQIAQVQDGKLTDDQRQLLAGWKKKAQDAEKRS
jgi:tetratricopeptide (TPR) repeat protein